MTIAVRTESTSRSPRPTSKSVPTIDLTIHFRRRVLPDDDWFLVRFRTRSSIEGFLEEDGEIWSRSGQLVAQSRQLALVVAIPLLD